MLDSFDAAIVREWCTRALASLRRHQREIDDLNVYPVPDGDTGTNMVLTVAAAADALAAENGDAAGDALHALARGALLGARGNSGVILSQLLLGLADAFTATSAGGGGQAFAVALTAAADAAYRAVAAPVEGTVLSVARAAADAARAVESDTLAVVVRMAAVAAREALDRTPEQLPVLAQAGVVDAGGRALCVVLDALADVVTGEGLEPGGPVRSVVDAATTRESGCVDYAYEVQYLLEAADDAVGGLRRILAALGDSLVVVGTGDGIWNVHVHVNDVGAAIEAGVEAGRPYRIAVTRFADQLRNGRVAGRPAAGRAVVAAGGCTARDRAVVAVAVGEGLARLFAAEGVTVVMASEGGTPSTAEIIAAIRATGTNRVIVLPNDTNAVGVASAAAEEARKAGVRVSVVRTRSPVQALSALAVRDPARRFDDDVIGMAEAAGACRYAEVTVASRAALTVAGPCVSGDVIALVEGEVNLIGQNVADTAKALLDRMLAGGGELVTLIIGQDAPNELADELTAHLAQGWPFTEVNVYDGGQRHYPLLVGVE